MNWIKYRSESHRMIENKYEIDKRFLSVFLSYHIFVCLSVRVSVFVGNFVCVCLYACVSLNERERKWLSVGEDTNCVIHCI